MGERGGIDKERERERERVGWHESVHSITFLGRRVYKRAVKAGHGSDGDKNPVHVGKKEPKRGRKEGRVEG